MKQKLLLFCFVLTSFVGIAQNVIIPDVNFKSYLVNNLAINTNGASGDTEIQITEAIAFSGTIELINLGITDLTGIEDFLFLEGLTVEQNQLTSLDLSQNTNLKDVRLSLNSQLTSVNLNQNIDLQILSLSSNNQLTSIDISNNVNLDALNLTENTSVTSIDLSQNINLEYFETFNTSFVSIDLSNNALLDFVYLYDNSNLVNIDIANGNNSNIQFAEILGNTSLSCIQIDAGFTPPTTNWNKDATATYSDNCAALCTVNIPDANFKAALVANTAINLDGDLEIQCSEASAYAGAINLNGTLNGNISDFTGLEAFTEITEVILSDSSSNVQNLDLSANTKIESLTIFQDNFTTIDISTLTVLNNIYFNNFQTLSALDLTNNLALRTFRADRMALNTIDFTGLINLESVEMRIGTLTSATFTNNPLLNEITIIENQLNNIDVSSLQGLVTLDLFDNQLSAIDVTQNANLEVLSVVSNSNLSALDVTQNSVLTILGVGGNSIATLDLSQNGNLAEFFINGITNFTTIDLSNNTNVSYMEINNSPLTALDLSANILLEEIYITDNTSLSSLNLANSNNNTLFFADLGNNSNLTCIQIDAGFIPPTNGNWIKDATASYSDNCNPVCTVNIPDANFKAALVANTAINLDGDLEIQCSEASAYTGFFNTVGFGIISDLTGIEAFINLTGLSTNNNNLSSVDLSSNTALETLSIENNNLTSLNLSANIAIEVLALDGNSIASLDLSNNTMLRNLLINDNQISSLILPITNSLERIEGENNLLTTIDLTGNPSITRINLINNDLVSIDLNSNVLLERLFLDENNLTSLNVLNNSELEIMWAEMNNIGSIDVSNNTKLTELKLGENSIQAINITTLSVLNQLVIYNNNLSSANLANGNNNGLNFVSITGNPNLGCINIDSGFTPTGNWLKDATATYSDNCANLSTEDFEINSFNLYPNPVSDILTLESNTTIETLEIYSVLGKKVKHYKNTYQIDASELNSGVYFLKIYSEKGVIVTKRFVKQ